MALLNESLQKIVDDLVDRSYQTSPNESVQLMLEAWSTLPEPKFTFDDSYRIAKRIINSYMDGQQLAEAKKWSDTLYSCDTERIDSGEREFFSGKVAYEMGDKDKAKEYFVVANQKSRGRCFIDEEKKYKNLIK